MDRIENHSHMLEITSWVAILLVFMLFGTSEHNVAQTLFVLQKTWHTTLFGIYYSVEEDRFVYHRHMLVITC